VALGPKGCAFARAGFAGKRAGDPTRPAIKKY